MLAETKNVPTGTVYDFLLSVFDDGILLKRLLGTDSKATERLICHISHAIYGPTRTWVGSRLAAE